ncbi:hypothetical protein K458DRAFT_397541 [Lentithecium fluviatile CBS 122367]|uniref:Uncharacterized protein n=1 Tax=Lentithecium fluviatile CBS 122367 TaxID=1168545 RepID=A0A6G1ID17_9PLEO|nr:hypothetical protein K458DRAFT_397541 [Lentithecium fluviatile CBS 122367]
MPIKPAPKERTPASKPKKPTLPPKPKKCTRANNEGCGKTREYEIDGPRSHLGAHHTQVAVGTVRKNAAGELDFEAVGTQLVKEEPIDENELKAFCKSMWGPQYEADCLEEFKCQEALNRHPRGRFKFEGEAAPEFADPRTFFQVGERLVEEHPNYKIIFNDWSRTLPKSDLRKFDSEKGPSPGLTKDGAL